MTKIEQALRDLIAWADDDAQVGTESLVSLQLRLQRARVALAEHDEREG